MKYSLIAAALLAYSSVSAAVLVTEGFNYPSGALTGQSGGTGFTAAWALPAVNTPASAVTFPVVATGLTGSAVPGGVSGGAIEDANGSGAFKNSRAFDATGLYADGNTIWYSFLATQGIAGNASIRFGTTEAQGQNNGIGMSFNVTNGIRAAIGGTSTSLVNALALNTTYFIVGKASFSAAALGDTSQAWVLPATAIPADVSEASLNALALHTTLLTGDAIMNTTGNIMYLASFATSTTTLDEIRVGTTLADVVVPEPSTYALLAGSSIVLLALLRRRK
ncbi:MAG: PEP-CTERM sorting domain-containing protein [Verrucomicrobiota bacterium]|nr:PEP-CTERM sorting domain-containing protein [Verrucomicrobiota bacterium]